MGFGRRLRLASTIAGLPGNTLRVRAYRAIGYRIGKNVYIARGSVLLCQSCVLGDGVKIGVDNHIHAMKLEIGARTEILRGNRVEAWAGYSGSAPEANSLV